MKKRLINKINFKRILLHMLFWIGFIIYFSIISGNPDNYWLVTKMTVYQLPFDFIVVYFSLYILIPKLFEPGKYILFTLSFITLCLLMILLQRIYFYELVIPDVVEKYDYNYWTLEGIFDVLKDNLLVYFLPVFYKIMRIWYEKQIETKNLQNKQIKTQLKLKEAEIKLLKAQLHPHFLFNTLNNLYGLAIAKSDLAPDIVIKISEILDYMLYECNSNSVKLVNELKYLKNYIELEKIRYRNKLKIEYFESGIQDNIVIAPLLLLPFIENCFKHGASKQLNNSWIHISANVQDDHFEFKLSNSKVNLENQKSNNPKGIGIENVKKRLELLYKNNYSLEIQDLNDKFIVNLTLKLIKLENKVHYN